MRDQLAEAVEFLVEARRLHAESQHLAFVANEQLERTEAAVKEAEAIFRDEMAAEVQQLTLSANELLAEHTGDESWLRDRGAVAT